MRRIRVEMWDDVDYHEDGTLTEANVTVRIRLEYPDERRTAREEPAWELDLSERRHTELREFLRPYLEAAHRPEAGPPEQEPRPSGKRMTIAEFARRNGIRYRTPAGHYSYNNELRRQYAEFLAIGPGQNGKEG